MDLGHKQGKFKTRIRPYQPIEEARARAWMALQAALWWRTVAWAPREVRWCARLAAWACGGGAEASAGSTGNFSGVGGS